MPVLGYLPFLDCRRLHQSLMSLGRRYGNVFSLKIGAQTVVVLNSADVIRECLVEKATSFDGRPVWMLNKVNQGRGEGLFVIFIISLTHCSFLFTLPGHEYILLLNTFHIFKRLYFPPFTPLSLSFSHSLSLLFSCSLFIIISFSFSLSLSSLNTHFSLPRTPSFLSKHH